MSDNSVVIGEKTSSIVQQQEQVIQQAQEKKQTAITAFLEGKGVEKPVSGMEQMPDGSIVVNLQHEDENEDDSE